MLSDSAARLQPHVVGVRLSTCDSEPLMSNFAGCDGCNGRHSTWAFKIATSRVKTPNSHVDSIAKVLYRRADRRAAEFSEPDLPAP